MEQMRAAARGILSRMQSATRTDLSYIIGGGSWLAVSQVAGAGMMLLLSVAFAHALTKEAYGTYRFLLSFFWILTAFSLTGISTSVAQAVAQGKEGAFLKGVRTSILGGIPFFIIAVFCSLYYFLNENPELGAGLFVIALLGPFVQPAFLFGALLEGKQDFRRSGVYGIVLVAVPVAAALAALPFTESALVFLGVYLLSNVAVGAFLSWRAYLAHQPNKAESNDTLRLTGHFSLINFLATIAYQMDKVVVFHYLGAAQVAVYAFATALPEQAKGVFNVLEKLALPRFSKRDLGEVLGNLWGRMFFLTFLLAAAAGAYILVAPYLFSLLFPTYQESVFYSQVYALSLIFVGSGIPYTLLQAQGAKEELYAYSVIFPLFQIGVLILFTLWGGILGAIVSRIVSRFFNLILISALVWMRNHRTQVSLANGAHVDS